MPRYKLGKQRPKIDSRTLMFGAYLTRELAPPPAAVDYSKPVKHWPMMANDHYGDCTCAAAGHMIEEWTANTGQQVTLTDVQILKAYNHFAKGNPDAGAHESVEGIQWMAKCPVRAWTEDDGAAAWHGNVRIEIVAVREQRGGR